MGLRVIGDEEVSRRSEYRKLMDKGGRKQWLHGGRLMNSTIVFNKGRSIHI